VLDDAGLRDVGILADTYNLAGEEPADLAAAVDRIAGVHVADELPEPLPGVRALPAPHGRSAALVEALRAAGWEGTLDVEIFSTPAAFWALPPEQAARAAYDAVSALWP
jgi:sugar phosphate isomerase/epimerase